jgi:hypothetical protein
MTDLASKPARSAQNRELTFEQLLDSDEAAALLKIHPKTSKEWLATARSRESRSEDSGASVRLS